MLEAGVGEPGAAKEGEVAEGLAALDQFLREREREREAGKEEKGRD